MESERTTTRRHARPGGSFTTRSGLTFYSVTQDYYLRAFNTETGEEVWKARLPSGSQSTPMTYMDKRSGRQYIVVTAGGARYNPNDRGDYIIAFALPEKSESERMANARATTDALSQ